MNSQYSRGTCPELVKCDPEPKLKVPDDEIVVGSWQSQCEEEGLLLGSAKRFKPDYRQTEASALHKVLNSPAETFAGLDSEAARGLREWNG